MLALEATTTQPPMLGQAALAARRVRQAPVAPAAQRARQAPGGGSPDAGEDAPVDHKAPTVVSISPEDDAKFIGDDVPIVITFSEPMNRTLTEAAFTLGVVQAGTSSPVVIDDRSWNSEGTELTVQAQLHNALVDVVGNDGNGGPPTEVLTTIAPVYTISLGTAAEDLAGNALQQAFNSEFSTRIRVIHHFSRNGPAGNGSSSGGTGTFITAGDNEANNEIRGFVTFTFTGLPDNIQEIERAYFTTYLWVLSGDPLADQGAMHVEHMIFDTVSHGFNTAPLTDLGPLYAPGDTPAEDDVIQFDLTAAVEDDYENRIVRADRTQYRFRFPNFVTPTDGENDQFRLYHRDGDDASFDIAAELSHEMEDFSYWPVLTVEYFLE